MGNDWTIRQLAAEFIATSTFVWAGCGAAVASNRWTADAAIFDPSALVSIALAFGLTISVLAYGIGHISGGHMNPAVTLSFMLLRIQSVTAGLLYMLAQCLGAIVGAFILWGCTASLTAGCDEFGDVGNQERISGVCKASRQPDGNYGPPFGLGLNVVNERVSNGAAFIIEVMGTFLLVFTVLHAAVHSKSTGGNAIPIPIGWAVLVSHIVLIPSTGCGINPARSLGPMVVDSIGGAAASVWVRGWWIFYSAPFVGSVLAAGCYNYIFKVKDDDAAQAKKVDDIDVESVSHKSIKSIGDKSEVSKVTGEGS
jgi:MIP family channel proteins